MRVQARITGVVQGVGFRPYVFRLAHEHGLGGWVLNDAAGVVVEAEGDPASVSAFLSALPASAPPLARIDDLVAVRVAPRGDSAFAIAPSPPGGDPDALVSPDMPPCDDCLAELFDPRDRRYRYPFINCTNCGPRFTIVRGVPYDRPLTTMAGFAMCDACRAEYENPRDRRFHAQPNACPECGPRLTLALPVAADVIRGGGILAVKGVGGYHLACRADDERAVATLRARKHREERPFAVMVPDLRAALALIEVPDPSVLRQPARPIVIAPRRAPLAPSVAPRCAEYGVMLPYSPLHHLLLRDLGMPLVMTSGNVSDEPIAYRDEDARGRLAGLADAFLSHDRPIETRTDDSVVRGRTVIRRSRGFVPDALALPVPAPPLLAYGAQLKSTFCVARGRRAWVSHHIGDLENYETLRSFLEGVARFERLFAVEPSLVAHDLHPEYLSTKLAVESELPAVAVQHHHAHLAACLAEHGETGPAVGAIFDGTGYGSDGTIWGGEVLRGDLRSFTREAWLFPVRLPGGDAAIREPWRMACAWLVAAGLPVPAEWRVVEQLVRSGVASPPTSSVGRLFDAVACLAGLRAEVTYEGQAAVELEAVCARGDHGAYPLGGDLDARELIACVVADRSAAVAPGIISARFHAALAAATAAAALGAVRADEPVVLSGGTFQNRILLEATTAHLRAAGARVLVSRLLPPNDGGIAFGQAAVAAACTASAEA